jgi:hypothetical protein
MRLFLLITLFITTKAFAVDICQFPETSNFYTELKVQGIRPARISKNAKKFTSVEIKLINKTVRLQDRRNPTSLQETLEEFMDVQEGGKPGLNAGEILYYNFEGTQYLLVHYWPGENEYGAYYKLNKNGSFKLITQIIDSGIECKGLK